MSEQILDVLREEIGLICEVNASEESTLFDLGADSLVIVELWARLEVRLERPIDISELLGGRNLASIARMLEGSP
ncbi:acyl carrier protein [Microbacterium sp. A8/3-1]|uniref:Acyl carrier protein n=1 Tax=Microbacterium sp. A8/3-1 TaxID=3160749 RepID=A0AAU7VZV2_9MICO